MARRLATAALLAAAAVAGTFQLRSTDFFWHLVTGRWILEHRAVPHHDPFRFTSDAEPGRVGWVDHEWLFQVLLAAGEKLGGVPALQLGRAALVTGLAALLLVSLRRSGAPPAAAVLVTLVALLGARERFLLRPELASTAGLVVLLALLSAFRRAPPAGRWPPPRLIAGHLLLGVVWANGHPGVLAAPVVAGAFLVGSRLPGGRRGPRTVPWGAVFLLPALLAAAVAVTPYGAHTFAVPFTIGASLEDLPGFNPEWQPVWQDPRPAFFLGAAAAAALGVLTLLRARRLDPATGLASLALFTLALTSVRHQGLFFFGTAFFAGECLADLARARATARAEASGGREDGEGPEPARGSRSLRWDALAALACLLAVAWWIWPPSRGPLSPRRLYPFGLGLQEGRYPTAAVDELERWTGVERWPGLERPYHDGVWGGYLLWRRYPPYKIFIDGRNEVNPELLAEIGAARRDDRRWRALLDRYRIDSALVRYDERPVPVLAPGGADPGERAGDEGRAVGTRTLHALLLPREEFALVWFDDLAMLFVRRTPDNAGALAEREYRHLHPEDWRTSLAAAAEDPRRLAALAEEIERRLGEHPPSARARRLAGAVEEIARARGWVPPL